MISYRSEDFENLEKYFRVNLINSVSGLRPVWLVGTRNAAGTDNLAIFNSLVHIGANPPLLGLVFRPDTVDRHTLSNIMDHGFYTLNAVTENLMEQAHQTSASYPEDVSEFEATGIEKENHAHIKVAFVSSSPIKMVLKFKERIDIQSNGTHLIIGSVEELHLDENMLDSEGRINPAAAKMIACAGLDTYFSAQKLGTFSYAKPNKALEKL